MYNTSNKYRLAVADSHRKSSIHAVIKTSEKTIIIDDKDIIKDSVYITNQCTNGNEFEYGCVYAGECGLTIKSDIDRYSLYDAEMTLTYSLWTGEAYESVPLGTFYITEPNRVNDKINIKALDSMTKFDVSIDADTQGTMPELVHYACEKCGVYQAQTPEELAQFVNSDMLYSVYSENVETFRDLLAYLGMLSAGFFTIDRHNRLVLRPYAKTKSVTLGKKQRFTNATFSDYTTKFNKIKARFVAEENYYPYEVTMGNEGLTLDMGDIPIMRGLPATKLTVLTNVMNVLSTVSYTPCEIETLGNPALDLGDLIANENVGKDSKTYYSPITYSYWTYRGKHKLKAVGGNPKLTTVKDKSSKNSSSLENEINSKTLVIKEYRNASDISVGGTAVEIATINYASTEESKQILLLSVRINATNDGLLKLQFCTDGVADDTRLYKRFVQRGDNIVTISDIYTADSNERRTISVMASMEYFESDDRKQNAKCITITNFLNAIASNPPTVSNNIVSFPAYEQGVIDTTVATGLIKANESLAILFGQGIATGGQWDGTLTITEDISNLMKFTSVLERSVMNDVVSVSRQNPTTRGITEAFGTHALFGAIGFSGITEGISFGEVIENYTFNTNYADNYTFDRYISTNNSMFALKTIYTYESAEQTIDSGRLYSVAIDYTGIEVESVVVENG